MAKKPVKKAAKKKLAAKPSTVNQAWEIAFRQGGCCDIGLRDWFAGMALAGVVLHWNRWTEENVNAPEMNRPATHWERRAAVEAYRYADAMIQERNKQPAPASPMRGEQHKET